MGTVWAARHELLGRDFALKFARVPTRTEPALRTRFLHEAQLVGKLRHPNIVDVTDFGEIAPDGDFFLAMELLEGESLADRIANRGPLDSYEAVSIAADIASGLSAVHAIGIVHRDVKPENIFLARSSTGSVVPKLLDFGISKEWNDVTTAQNAPLTGTPAYMSPEQANGETKLDPRTDVWSLGVVLYEMLTGKHPFVEQNYQALMTAIAERPHAPLDPTVPLGVRRLIDRCLSKQPEARHATCSELAIALRESISAKSHVRTQQRSFVLTATAIGLCVLAAITSAAFWMTRTSSTTDTPITSATTVITAHPEALASTPAPSSHSATPHTGAPTSATASHRTPPATRPVPTPRDKRVSTSVDSPGF